MELTEDEVKDIVLTLTHISKEIYKAILSNPKPSVNGEPMVVVPAKGLKELADNINLLCTQIQTKNSTPPSQPSTPPNSTIN